MCNIVLPIKPKYTKAILSGDKIFELRRSIPKRKVDGIYIYETAPVSKIVGYIKIKQTHKLEISKLWNLTEKSNAISKSDFMKYFKGKKVGYTYEISNYKRFDKEESLSKYNIKAAPQGFIYVD